MERDDVISVLTLLDINSEDVAIRQNNQLQISCPLSRWLHDKQTDEKPSLSIHYSDDKPTVFKCFACLESGKLWQLVESYSVLAKRPELRDVARKLVNEDRPDLRRKLAIACRGVRGWVQPNVQYTPRIFPEAIRRYPLAVDVLVTREYLAKRGVSTGIARRFEIRYDGKEDRIVFPVYDEKDQLIGAVGRALSTGSKYKNYFGFTATHSLGGINHCNKEFRKLLVVEGYFCLLHIIAWCNDLSIDVVCTWRAEMSKIQAGAIISLDKLVIIGYDTDSPGIVGWVKAKGLLEGRVLLRRARLFDDRDWGDLTKKEFIDVLDGTLTRKVLK